MSDASPASPAGGFLSGLMEDVSTLTAPLPTPSGGSGGDSDDEADYADAQAYGKLDLSSLSDLLHMETSLRATARAEVERVLQKWLSPHRVLLRDKCTMVLFTLHIVVGSLWLGSSPQTFYRLYTAEGALLMVLRWISYRWQHAHYYLLDWCYLANAMLSWHVWKQPAHVLLSKIMFAHALGPLLWSIVAFRNSLVYHSLDKMSSHYLHFYPSCVCWAIRWHTQPDSALGRHLAADPAAAAAWERASIRDLVLLPMIPYTVWALLYYLKVFVISASKVQQRGYETLFKYSTQSRRSLFGAVVLRFPPSLQPVVYMLMHQALTLAAMSLNLLWWSNYWACSAFLMAIFLCSAWTGATFMFDVFAIRYPHPKRGAAPRPRSSTPSVQQEASTANNGAAERQKAS